jgi:serine/threonine protein kinase/tetratricopeptide (TPR) repeat protein
MSQAGKNEVSESPGRRSRGATTGGSPRPFDDSLPRAEVVGTTIGRYIVIRELGAGGMGVVYSAFDPQLDRKVAIKVLRTRSDGDGQSEIAVRLLREAQAMARLAHPNVVSVHDVGTIDGSVFLAMEHVDGCTLREWSKEKRTWRERLELLKAAGRGLAAAHAAGLVHRDFKPDNVLVGIDGRARVTDFGIACARDDENPSAVRPASKVDEVTAAATRRAISAAPRASVAPKGTGAAKGPATEDRSHDRHDTLGVTKSLLADPLTVSGSILGTVGYMAPEQAFGGQVDARSDQFSFCVALYAALYGEKPFSSRTLDEYLEALSEPLPPPPPSSNVPAWIRRVLVRGLSESSEDRYPSMNALLEALEQDPTQRRRRMWIGVAAALACAAAVGGYSEYRSELRARCDQGAKVVAQVWNQASRTRVHDALKQSGVPLAGDIADRVQRRLDEYASQWASEYADISAATLLHGQQSEPVMRQRLVCLDGTRQELDALVRVLADGQAKVAQSAVNAVFRLPVPSACTEEASRGLATSPAGAGVDERIRRAERALAEAQALQLVGQTRHAVEVVDGALPEVRAIGHRHIEAELLSLVGTCHFQLFELVVATQSYEAAFVAAEAAGAGALAARVAAQAAFSYAEQSNTGAARHWLAVSRGILERLGPNDALEVEALNAEVILLRAEGHPERSIASYDRAIELSRKLYGPWTLALARLIENKCNALSDLAQFDRAVPECKRANEVVEHVTGPDNPYLNLYYNNLGFALTQWGHLGEAKAALEHALALGSLLGDPSTVNALSSLATLYNRMGDPSRALEASARGMASARVSGATATLGYRWLLFEHGRALAKLGELSKGEADCREALELQEKTDIAPDRVYAPDALACLGEIEIAQGRLPAAIEHLERSVSLERRDDPGELSLARFDLARALHAAGAEPERARALARRALDDLRTRAGRSAEVAAVEQWLRDVER